MTRSADRAGQEVAKTKPRGRVRRWLAISRVGRNGSPGQQLSKLSPVGSCRVGSGRVGSGRASPPASGDPTLEKPCFGVKSRANSKFLLLTTLIKRDPFSTAGSQPTTKAHKLTKMVTNVLLLEFPATVTRCFHTVLSRYGKANSRVDHNRRTILAHV